MTARLASTDTPTLFLTFSIESVCDLGLLLMNYVSFFDYVELAVSKMTFHSSRKLQEMNILLFLVWSLWFSTKMIIILWINIFDYSFCCFLFVFFLQPAVFNIGPIEAQPLCVLNKLIRKPVKIFCFFVLFCFL